MLCHVSGSAPHDCISAAANSWQVTLSSTFVAGLTVRSHIKGHNAVIVAKIVSAPLLVWMSFRRCRVHGRVLRPCHRVPQAESSDQCEVGRPSSELRAWEHWDWTMWQDYHRIRIKCPVPRSFKLDGKTEALVEQLTSESHMVAMLQSRIGLGMVSQLEQVLQQRTRSVRFVFEAPGNLSNLWACLRTMDSFGVQYGEIIDHQDAGSEWNDFMFRAAASQSWITVRRWSCATTCVEALHSEGYQVLLLDLDPSSRNIDELLPRWAGVDCGSKGGSPPLALVIGNELDGVSDAMRQVADERAFFETHGMCQSFNMSVACTLMLASLSAHGLLIPGNLSAKEEARLRLCWLVDAYGSQDAEALLLSSSQDSYSSSLQRTGPA